MGEVDLLHIATLLDDLKHDEINMRVNSMRHLKEITEALGAGRTRDELLPFLGETVMDDEDEVLLVAAEEFGKLTDQVGGVQHIPCLLKVLEDLVSVDEPTVRAKAIISIYDLVALMAPPAINQHFAPLVRRLAEKEWFTARSAACALFCAGYKNLSDESKAEFRGLFGNLCKDDTPTVRKAAAEHIGKFASVVDYHLVKEELYPLFEALAKDEQDSVRLQTVKNVIEFTKVEKRLDRKQEILKIVFNLAQDAAWRVKWTVADSFLQISQLVIENQLANEIPKFIRLYGRLLLDEEPEVRAAAVTNLTAIGKVFSKSETNPEQFADAVLPNLPHLVDDPSEFVRSATASVVFGLAPVVGKEKAIADLVPIFLTILKDRESQVNINLIATLDDLEGVVPLEYIADGLLPSVDNLAKNSVWRIRHSMIGHIPLIAKHLGREQFDDKLMALCMGWLEDEVFSIREAATENLQKLTELFGEEWTKATVLAKVASLATNESYLFRMQALRAVESLSPVVTSEVLNKELLPHVLRLASNKTPNIRFNVAKCLHRIGDKIDGELLENEVKPILEAMLDDEDTDVKYFAGRALEVLLPKKA